MGLLFSYILCLQIGIAFVGRNLILEVILTLLIKTFQLKLKSIGTKIVCDISTFLFSSDFSYDFEVHNFGQRKDCLVCAEKTF